MLHNLQSRLIRNFAVKLLLLCLATGLVVAATGYWYYRHSITKPLDFGTAVFVINKGETLITIGRRLVQTGVVWEPWSLRILAKQRGNSRSMMAGEYDFPDVMTLQQFLDAIVAGKGQVDMRVTIVEGSTFKQMRALLANAPKLSQDSAGLSTPQLMQRLGFAGQHPEGRFYPETYYYRSGDSDFVVYRKAYQLMQKKLAAAWRQRRRDSLLKSSYEVLILASIIEKETWVRDEQPIIAGVLINRLKKGMRLQTDPTVIYGLGDAYAGNITRKHLRADTPYNTYTRTGLPPTPISLPGGVSLMAAAKPATTKAYYFVAMGGGRHFFSNTLQQHNAAVRKYIHGK